MVCLRATKNKEFLYLTCLIKVRLLVCLMAIILQGCFSINNGNPSITLLEKNKKPAIAMLNTKGKGSLLGVWNSQGKPRISMGLLNDTPNLFLYQQYRTGLLFNMQAGGRPALALMQDGSPIWSATGAAPPPAPDMSGLDDIMRDVLR